MIYAVICLPRALRRSQEHLAMNLKRFEEKLKEREAEELAQQENQIKEGGEEEPTATDDKVSSASQTPEITTTAPQQDSEPKKEL